ncbi:plasmid pRiA4b ORF-3 family protein [Sulfurimonas sp. NWX79]
MHEFRKNNLFISNPEFYDDDMYEFEDEKIVDENEMQISEILQSPKDKIKYLYDFGDNWELSVSLEKIIDVQEGVAYPRCIRGKRCAPPEDVGGVWGFEEFKKTMTDRYHEEHENYKEWYGGEFNPDFVDFETINEQLQAYSEESGIEDER